MNDNRVALLGIIVENHDSVRKLNDILHEYESYIIGRMGIPHREREISLISVAVDAPQDIISSLAGKIGTLSGITSKVIYDKIRNVNDI